MMKIGQRGLALIQDYETLKLVAYQGAADKPGVLTIGWGHTGSDVMEGMEISRADAAGLLKQDLAEAEAGVLRVINQDITTHAQFDAMVSLAYNIGVTAFGKSTVARLHNFGNFFDAAVSFAMWKISNGKPRRGLIKRRFEEARLYCDDRFIDVETTDG